MPVSGGYEMKTVIVYYSKHHGNTKKLVDAIAARHSVTLIDVTENPTANLGEFDRIGFASGIYYNSFARPLLAYAAANLPEEKDVFLLSTQGNPKGRFFKAIERIVIEKRCRSLGRYGCQGFDTFGPLRLVGGISKGHPTAEEIDGAVRFYEGL